MMKEDTRNQGFVRGEGVHRRDTIGRVAQEYTRELRGPIEHCRGGGGGGYTPSDFPLVYIDEATLALLHGDFEGFEELEELAA